MNNNQQNPNWNPNNQDGSGENMNKEGAANPQMNMANMPGGNMEFPAGMMPYGVPNFMSQLQMQGMPPGVNMAAMFPGGQGMMPQDGNNMPNNAQPDQNKPQTEEGQNAQNQPM